jgi:hypothetical protein
VDFLLVFVRIVAGDSPGVPLSHHIESLEDLWSKSFSRGSFSNTLTMCSVKCLRGDKLVLSRVFVVDLSCGLTSTFPYFRCSS